MRNKETINGYFNLNEKNYQDCMKTLCTGVIELNYFLDRKCGAQAVTKCNNSTDRADCPHSERKIHYSNKVFFNPQLMYRPSYRFQADFYIRPQPRKPCGTKYYRNNWPFK